MLKTIGGRWLHSQSEQRRVKQVGGQEANRDTAKGGEEIGLENKRREWLAAVVTFGSAGHNVATFYTLSRSAISEMKSSVGFSWAERAASLACRRHSLANPSERVSGTQICTGRNPLRRRR